MTETKRRQGQIKADGTKATPKPVCPKCGEITVRVSFRGDKNRGRAYIPTGWMCPSSTCDYIIKDYVELKDDEENVDNVKDFAEACCDQKSLKELKAALAGAADEADMKTWNITEDQWRKAMKVAIIAIENSLSVDEAIKCSS